MNKVISTQHWNGMVIIRFQSGQELTFSVQGNPRLEQGNDVELNEIEISPFGIHWPRLDEDLSFEGILQGNYGQVHHK